MHLLAKLDIARPVLPLIAADGAVLLGVGVFAGWIEQGGKREAAQSFDKPLVFGALVALTFLTTNLATGIYSGRHVRARAEVLSRLVSSFGLGFLVLAAILFLIPGLGDSRLSAAIPLLVALPIAMVVHLAFPRLVDVDRLKRRVIVVGAGELAARLAALEAGRRVSGFTCVGFIDNGSETIRVDRPRILGKLDALHALLPELQLDEIVIAVETWRQSPPIGILTEIQQSGIRITDYASFYERETGRVDLDTIRPNWFLFSEGRELGWARDLLKRSFDIVVSLLLLVLTSPLMLATAIAIRVEGPGPILIWQERVGLGGRPFTLVKFRSMHVNAERDGEARWAAINDPRITILGQIIRKIRLDELPQLYNVLRGEMSIVGPRPERPQFVEMLLKSIPCYPARHRVHPGITGWAQIRYSYAASVDDAERKLAYDLYYIKHYSLLLDIVVIILTVRVILFPVGVR